LLKRELSFAGILKLYAKKPDLIVSHYFLLFDLVQ
jgi:hypothetical protein